MATTPTSVVMCFFWHTLRAWEFEKWCCEGNVSKKRQLFFFRRFLFAKSKSSKILSSVARICRQSANCPPLTSAVRTVDQPGSTPRTVNASWSTTARLGEATIVEKVDREPLIKRNSERSCSTRSKLRARSLLSLQYDFHGGFKHAFHKVQWRNEEG